MSNSSVRDGDRLRRSETLSRMADRAIGSSKRPSIAAVVVTFNRKQLLIECLNGLLSQTVPLDRIYVIDNASTDGTPDALHLGGYLTNPAIRYVSLGSNMGGAGGFARGTEIAYNDGFDWLWLMDDDVEPYPNGLAQLLEFRNISGCIHGRRTNPDGSPVVWLGERFHEATVTAGPVSDPLFVENTRAQVINAGCFEGMLVSRDVVSQIGFPDPEFFITWDDAYYGYLASRVTTVLYVNAFVLKRKRTVTTIDSPLFGSRLLLSPLSLFYSQRNRWLIAKKLEVCGWRFWAATLLLLIRSLFREIVLVRSISRAGTIVKGVLSGMRWDPCRTVGGHES